VSPRKNKVANQKKMWSAENIVTFITDGVCLNPESYWSVWFRQKSLYGDSGILIMRCCTYNPNTRGVYRICVGAKAFNQETFSSVLISCAGTDNVPLQW